MNSAFSLPPQLSEKLTAWFESHARILPWRNGIPRDPYRVWISEIMLQQTRVVAVIGYFERFMACFPNIASLAAADESEVLKLWEGLGYYSRAKNLHKAAKQIIEDFDGIFPADYTLIRSLPGIGDYTAGTVAAICFNLACPSIDGNILRVMSRITGSYADITKPQTKKLVSDMLLPLYQNTQSRGKLTESLMELGALVCIPNGQPKCADCPVATLCKAFKENLTEQIPVKTKKPARIKEDYTVLILESDGRFALKKRPENGLLASLWEFVNCKGLLTEGEAAQVLNEYGMLGTEFVMMKHTTHIFTHREWNMRVYYLTCPVQNISDNFVWKRLDEITLPTAFKKLLRSQ